MIAVFIQTKAINQANYVDLKRERHGGGDDGLGRGPRAWDREQEHHGTHGRAQWSSAGGKKLSY